jgi:hypothetical protein
VQALVLSGADVNARTPSSASAIFIASYVGHTACVEVLLQAGANPNIGSSCSECARNRGFLKVAKILEQRAPGFVEGFLFESSVLFRKWRRRYFACSLSQGILFVHESFNPLGNSRTDAAHPTTRVCIRNSRLAQLERFEGKQRVLRIRSSDSSSPLSEVIFFEPNLEITLIYFTCRLFLRSVPSFHCS